MAQDTGEERNLPPTLHKLRKMRKDGQVATSKEFVSVSVFAFAFVYIFVSYSSFYTDIHRYFSFSFSPPTISGRVESGAALSHAAEMTGRIVGPLGFIVLVAAVLSSGLIMRGFPFSLKPLELKMDRLNPANGLKQIFAMKNLVDLGQSLIKFVICFAVVAIYVKSSMASLLWSPLCGSGCAAGLFAKMLTFAIGLILIGMLVIVLLDIKLSKWIFMRDAKMSISELKREMKEENGDPHLKQAMRQEGQRLVRSERRYSFEDANFLITGDGVTIGIQFMRGSSGAPMIASIGVDQQSRVHLARGAEKGLIIHTDPELARELSVGGRTGKMIPFELFDRTARAMVRAGFLS